MGVYERIYRFNSKWVKERETCDFEICLRSNLSNDNIISASLRGRRLKGKGKGVLGKGVLGARETCSIPLPFRTPATQAKFLRKGQVWKRVWILEVWSKTGFENYISWFEIRSGFGEPGGTPPPRIPRSTPPPGDYGDGKVMAIGIGAVFSKTSEISISV